MTMNFTDGVIVNYFYVGRIYQNFLDNKDDLFSGLIPEIGFLVPKTTGLHVISLRKMVQSLINDDKIVVKYTALPKRNGVRFSFSLKLGAC